MVRKSLRSEFIHKFSQDGWQFDLGIALLLTLITQISIWQLNVFPGPKILNSIFALLSTISLLWRRIYPLEVLALVVIALSAQSLFLGSTESAATMLPLMFAIYSAASHGKSALWIASLGLSGIVLFELKDPHAKTLGDHLFSPILVLVVYMFGRLIYLQRKRTSQAEIQAELIKQNHETIVADSISRERTRIARELHDVIAHGISVMALQAGAAESVIDHEPQAAKDSLKIVRETGRSVVGEMSSLVSLLRDDKSGTVDPIVNLQSLEFLIDQMRGVGLQIDFVNELKGEYLPSTIEHAIFRVVQESLTNAVKHALNSPTTVGILEENGWVDIEIFSKHIANVTESSGGKGLVGMRERIHFVSGTFEAGPFQGGWKVLARIPSQS